MNKATRSEELNDLCMANSATKTPSKIARILAHLMTGASLNRFEAERIGDHCLSSTISRLANRYDVIFERQSEKTLNRGGNPCVVTRYSLLPCEEERMPYLLDYFLRRPKQPDDHGPLIAHQR
ncbi:hypothetical protein [Pseudomonas boanensis]|uniref:hypothetical protein n=1 Tax=Metapseudomonas boanensis TaxID=2822138 RepID=UPI0035D4F439